MLYIWKALEGCWDLKVKQVLSKNSSEGIFLRNILRSPFVAVFAVDNEDDLLVLWLLPCCHYHSALEWQQLEGLVEESKCPHVVNIVVVVSTCSGSAKTSDLLRMNKSVLQSWLVENSTSGKWLVNFSFPWWDLLNQSTVSTTPHTYRMKGLKSHSFTTLVHPACHVGLINEVKKKISQIAIYCSARR